MRGPARVWLVPVVVAVLLGIDQLSKAWVQSNLKLYSSIDVITGVFRLSYYANRGAVGGIGWHHPLTIPLLVGASVVIVALLIALYRYYGALVTPSWRMELFVAVSISPLISHSFDRLRQGYVVDFLHFEGLPIFNFADVLPNLAVLLLALELRSFLRSRRRAAALRVDTVAGIEGY